MNKNCPNCNHDLSFRFMVGRMKWPNCEIGLKYNHHPEEVRRGGDRMLIWAGIGIVLGLEFLGVTLPTSAKLAIGLLPILWVIGEQFYLYQVKWGEWRRYALRLSDSPKN